jgi:putative peptidoglycan lipid II flippase
MMPGFLSRVARIVMASVIMGGGIWFAAEWAKPWIMTDGDYIRRVAVLLVLVVAGAILYFAAVFATRVYTVGELKSRLRRTPRA